MQQLELVTELNRIRNKINTPDDTKVRAGVYEMDQLIDKLIEEGVVNDLEETNGERGNPAPRRTYVGGKTPAGLRTPKENSRT